MGKPLALETHRKIIGTSLEHRRIKVYPRVFAHVFSHICGYCCGSSRILACPGVSCSVLACTGGVLRNLRETCRVLRAPAASKKPRFPFLCTHRFLNGSILASIFWLVFDIDFRRILVPFWRSSWRSKLIKNPFKTRSIF